MGKHQHPSERNRRGRSYKPIAEEGVDMVVQRDWWDEQKDADGRFQAALRAAGMVEGVAEATSERPQPVPRPGGSTIQSSAGWEY